MESFKDQLFPPEFILDYLADEARKKRFLSYIAFRVLSLIGAENAALPERIRENLSCPFTLQSFCVIENYLIEDYYFSPSLAQNTFEPLYLYTAISLISAEHPTELSFFEELLAEACPAAAGTDYAGGDLRLSALLQSGQDFYTALYFAVTRYEAQLPVLLPQFMEAYQESYHFTCEDFILFDFMDEYFQHPRCIYHPSFAELVDTLVAATLNYHHTDIETLLQKEVAQMLSGSSSRFAGAKRIGSVAITASVEHDTALRMLTECFRYAAIYELRSNLFDFHLEEDKLITLENWKENLRWHYVQYANVYQLALDSFQSGILSRELLKLQFATNLMA